MMPALMRKDMDEDVSLPEESKPDLPPEFCQYKDEGCEVSASCLQCPLAQCVYEQPGGKQRWLKKQRDAELVRLRRDEGKKVKELAQRFGVSPRTVQRALKGKKGKTRDL